MLHCDRDDVKDYRTKIQEIESERACIYSAGLVRRKLSENKRREIRDRGWKK